MNIGDVIFQLISFTAAAFFLFAVIYVFRSLNKRRIQLDRIEKKLDALREEKRKVIVHSEAGATSSTFIRSGSSVYTA